MWKTVKGKGKKKKVAERINERRKEFGVPLKWMEELQI